jgi:8-oxo-dGTP pyrophosphatase MutT (NUDIX family)
VVSIEKLKRSLPEHPGIQLKEEYINTAVLVLLVFIDGEYHFIFQKRGPNIRQNGEICFPGGVHNAEDGTFEKTAIRETVEEMGIPAGKITVIGQLDTLIAPMGAMVNAFVGVADISGLDEISPNKGEVESVFSVPVSYFENNPPQEYRTQLKVHPSAVDEKTGEEIVLFPARTLGLPDKYSKPWGGMKHTIYVYKVGQNTIWGITAKFVMDVVRKIKAQKNDSVAS